MAALQVRRDILTPDRRWLSHACSGPAYPRAASSASTSTNSFGTWFSAVVNTSPWSSRSYPWIRMLRQSDDLFAMADARHGGFQFRELVLQSSSGYRL